MSAYSKTEVAFNILMLLILVPVAMVVEAAKVLWFSLCYWEEPFLLLQVIADKDVCPKPTEFSEVDDY